VSEAYPDVCLSMGPKEVLKLLLSSFKLYYKDIPGHCLQIPVYQYGLKLVTQRFINYVQKRGLKIMVWTINDRETMQALIDMGVDGIITDRPSALKELLSKD
jgi:glycerophosphoryl diester phosphodiesterase